jgi:Icc-related predicted phosphoesterase
MKTSIFIRLLLSVPTVAILSVSTFCQEAVNISVRQKKIANFPQEVAAKASTDANILIISGKILNAATLQPIGKTKINVDKLGDELVQASIDSNGNYAIALKKDELGEPIRIIFRVPGFKKFVAKHIDKSKSFADINILLEPEFSHTKKAGTSVVYKMNTDPFNPLVLKFE